MRISVLLIVALLIAPASHAATFQPSDPDACAAVISEIDAKNQMLQAKNELWNYGSTKTMAMHPDGTFISTSPARRRIIASPVSPLISSASQYIESLLAKSAL